MRLQKPFLFLLGIPGLLAACAPARPLMEITEAPLPTPAQNWWSPAQDSRFQIQFTDYPVDIGIPADVFEVDLFEAGREEIAVLHTREKKVICYINAGAWEEYRPDAGEFPAEIIGRDFAGWPGEKWLDVSRFTLFSNILEKRFDLALEKGCDAVETDNVEGYLQKTGFEITAADQLAYNTWLSRQAHSRGLGIGLKNDPEQVPELEPFFDFAVVEDCVGYDECGSYLPFIRAGKAVFQIEYTDRFKSASQFCEESAKNQFNAILKHRGLDAWVDFCP